MQRRLRFGLVLLGLWLLSCSAPQHKEPEPKARPSAGDLPEIDALWDYHAPAATEEVFETLLAKIEGTDAEDYRLELLTQIARAQSLQGDFETAHATLDQVEPALPTASKVVHARYLLERGRVFNAARQNDKAKTLFVAAWELCQAERNDVCAVDAAHMMGVIEPAAEATHWNEQALALALSSKQEGAKRWLGALYNNMGGTHHDQGEYEKALEMFQAGLAWRESQGEQGPILVARWSVGRTLRSLGRTKEALELQKALVKAHEEAGTTDGFVFEEVAECLYALGKKKDAKPFFTKAYEVLSNDPWMTQNETDRLERLRTLGK